MDEIEVDQGRFLSRSVTVRGVDVTVLQDMSTTAEGLGGAIVWDASLVLAHYFESIDDFPGHDHFHGLRVLELGAGCGLPSLVAAALGERALQPAASVSGSDVAQVTLLLIRIKLRFLPTHCCQWRV